MTGLRNLQRARVAIYQRFLWFLHQTPKSATQRTQRITESHREIGRSHSVFYSSPSPPDPQCSLLVFFVFSVLNSEKRDQQYVRRPNISTQFHGPILEVRCPAAANPLCSAFTGGGKSETLASPRKGVSMENH